MFLNQMQVNGLSQNNVCVEILGNLLIQYKASKWPGIQLKGFNLD